MPASRKKSWLLGSIVIVWFAVALAAYYVFHRPFPPAFIGSVFGSIKEIVFTLAIVFLGGAIGTRLLPKLSAAPLARLALRAALGMGALSIAYLLVGSTLGTRAWVAWLLLLSLLLWLRKDLSTWTADRSVKKLWASSDAFGKSVAILCGLIFTLTLLTALALPLKFDTLVYHLTLPKEYIVQGRITYVEDNVFWGFPQLPHVLSTWALALGGSRGALIGWVMGLFCILGLLGHLTALLGARAAWVAVASLLSGYSLAASLGWSYVDWPSMLMGWGALFFLHRWLGKSQPRWLIFAGIFCGFAFSAKYTAALLVPLGLLVVLWHRPSAWKQASLFWVASFVVVSPWLVKNFIATGSPIYPLLFPAGEMDAVRVQAMQGFAAQGSWSDALLLPLGATWLGIEGGRAGNATGYEGSLGPLILAIGVLSVLPANLSKGQHSLRRTAAIIALGGLLVWAVLGRLSGHLIRSHLYYSFFPALAILAAFGFGALERMQLPRLRLGRVAGALVIFVLALNLFQLDVESLNSGAAQLFNAQIGEQEYLAHNLGLYAPVMQSLQELPQTTRVVMLWEGRGYYCLPVCDPDELLDRWSHDLAVFETPDEVFAAWREAGYSYVLYYRLGARFVYEDPEHFHAFDLEELETALATLPLVSDYNGDYLLYSLSE